MFNRVSLYHRQVYGTFESQNYTGKIACERIHLYNVYKRKIKSKKFDQGINYRDKLQRNPQENKRSRR